MCQEIVRSLCARVAELVDALDLGSSGATRGGSTPPLRTLKDLCSLATEVFFCLKIFDQEKVDSKVRSAKS